MERHFAEFLVDAEGSQRRRQRDRRVRNRQRKRVDVPVIKVVKWDPQERLEEVTAEPPPGIAEYSATTAAEVVASTVVESVDGCEVRPPGVEVPEFVFQIRIQQCAFEQLADILEVVEEHIPERALAGCGGACIHCMSAWRW